MLGYTIACDVTARDVQRADVRSRGKGTTPSAARPVDRDRARPARRARLRRLRRETPGRPHPGHGVRRPDARRLRQPRDDASEPGDAILTGTPEGVSPLKPAIASSSASGAQRARPRRARTAPLTRVTRGGAAPSVSRRSRRSGRRWRSRRSRAPAAMQGFCASARAAARPDGACTAGTHLPGTARADGVGCDAPPPCASPATGSSSSPRLGGAGRHGGSASVGLRARRLRITAGAAFCAECPVPSDARLARDRARRQLSFEEAARVCAARGRLPMDDEWLVAAGRGAPGATTPRATRGGGRRRLPPGRLRARRGATRREAPEAVGHRTPRGLALGGAGPRGSRRVDPRRARSRGLSRGADLGERARRGSGRGPRRAGPKCRRPARGRALRLRRALSGAVLRPWGARPGPGSWHLPAHVRRRRLARDGAHPR